MEKTYTIKDIKNILYDLWTDDELQEAIANYGEWNNTELNKVFENIKNKILFKYR